MGATIAWIELTACWLVWAYPFVFRAPHFQKRESVALAGATRLGILLEAAAIGLAFIRAPGSPRSHPAALVAALVFGIIGATLAWTAVDHLGKQFRVHAGLYVDHELVRTGPYAIIRHPIYGSLLGMLLAVILLLTPWNRALLSLALFVIGTEIRVRTEDRLLASRFGTEFAEYRKRVPAYIPFVR
jgi:protein-S-isoprenylcysteine O-methyltransferase Ste14